MFDAGALFGMIQKVKKGYEKQLEPLMDKYGLTKNQIDILMFLKNNPQYNTLSDLVEIRAMTKSQASVSIEEMRKRGIIEKEQGESDKRSNKLIVSEHAKEITKEGKLIQQNFEKMLAKNLSPLEIVMLKKVFATISENINNL